MSGSLAQFGIADETEYGTAVAVTKFYEILKEDIRGNYSRLQGEGLGKSLVARADRFAAIPKGAAGSVEFEVLTKGFEHWLKHITGKNEAGTPGGDGEVLNTATIDELSGKAFTAQVGRPQSDGTLIPFTYQGGKVMSFELTNSVDQILVAKLDLDFAKETGGSTGTGPYALQAQALPTGAELFTWAGGSVMIGMDELEVEEFTLTVENNLKDDSYTLGHATSKKEPRQNEKREIKFEVKIEFDSMDIYNKIASATASGAIGSLVARWEGPTPISTEPDVFPYIEVTLPVARFDEGVPVVEGPELLMQEVSGVGLFNGIDNPMTIKYLTVPSA